MERMTRGGAGEKKEKEEGEKKRRGGGGEKKREGVKEVEGKLAVAVGDGDERRVTRRFGQIAIKKKKIINGRSWKPSWRFGRWI